MDQMNISVTDHLAEYVRARVKSGRYNNASEVVREALRRMQLEDERAQRIAEPTAEDIVTNLGAAQVEGIRRRVIQGLEEIENGEFVDIRNRTELRELFEGVRERGRRRVQEGAA